MTLAAHTFSDCLVCGSATPDGPGVRVCRRHRFGVKKTAHAWVATLDGREIGPYVGTEIKAHEALGAMCSGEGRFKAALDTRGRIQ